MGYDENALTRNWVPCQGTACALIGFYWPDRVMSLLIRCGASISFWWLVPNSLQGLV